MLRKKDIHPGALMTMVPTLVMSSIGAGWSPVDGSLSDPAASDPSPSASHLWKSRYEVHPDTQPTDVSHALQAITLTERSFIAFLCSRWCNASPTDRSSCPVGPGPSARPRAHPVARHRSRPSPPARWGALRAPAWAATRFRCHHRRFVRKTDQTALVRPFGLVPTAIQSLYPFDSLADALARPIPSLHSILVHQTHKPSFALVLPRQYLHSESSQAGSRTNGRPRQVDRSRGTCARDMSWIRWRGLGGAKPPKWKAWRDLQPGATVFDGPRSTGDFLKVFALKQCPFHSFLFPVVL